MDVASFRASTADDKPKAGLKGPLLALWHAARGEWHKAHEIIQDDVSKEAAWVHAHLHRVEGDDDNAAYWYGQAGKPPSKDPLDTEWNGIAAGLLMHYD